MHSYYDVWRCWARRTSKSAVYVDSGITQLGTEQMAAIALVAQHCASIYRIVS